MSEEIPQSIQFDATVPSQPGITVPEKAAAAAQDAHEAAEKNRAEQAEMLLNFRNNLAAKYAKLTGKNPAEVTNDEIMEMVQTEAKQKLVESWQKDFGTTNPEELKVKIQEQGAAKIAAEQAEQEKEDQEMKEVDKIMAERRAKRQQQKQEAERQAEKDTVRINKIREAIESGNYPSEITEEDKAEAELNARIGEQYGRGKYPEGKVGEELYIGDQMRKTPITSEGVLKKVPETQIPQDLPEQFMKQFRAASEQDKRIAQSKAEGVAQGRAEEEAIAARQLEESGEQPVTKREGAGASALASEVGMSEEVAKQEAPSRAEAGGMIDLRELMRQGEEDESNTPPSSAA